MKSHSRILFDVGQRSTYHSYGNCPAAEKISELDRTIATEQIAQSQGMERCSICSKMESSERDDDLPYGRDVQPTSKIGVALSGGGHRATLFGLGVLMYLVHARRNEWMSVNNDVFEISSVSGGSITNGYVAQSLDYQSATVEDFDEVAGRLASQIAKRGTFFEPWWSRAYVVALVLVALLTLVGAVSVLFFRGEWHLGWTVVAATTLLLFLSLGLLAQLRGLVCEMSFTRTLFFSNGAPTKLRDVSRRILHVICATEVQTGNAAYFSPEFVFSNGFEPRRPEDLSLSRAVRASAALPFAFPPCRIQAKPARGLAWLTAKREPQGMLLVDGGVRDNLGADWFTDPVRRQDFFFPSPGHQPSAGDPLQLPPKVLPLPFVEELIVVGAASNRIKPASLRADRPILGELSSLLKLTNVPYNTREAKTRRALNWQFVSAPRLTYEDGRLRVSGTVLHIEESPTELAEEILLWHENFSTPPSDRSDRLNFDWSRRSKSDSGTVETVDLLDWHVLRDAGHKAQTVLDAIAAAEDEDELAAAAQDRELSMARIQPAWDSANHEAPPKRELAAIAWNRRTASNAAVTTNLSALGADTAASLMRHGFVLAMAKLHLLLDYPLCSIPSTSDFRKFAEGGR